MPRRNLGHFFVEIIKNNILLKRGNKWLNSNFVLDPHRSDSFLKAVTSKLKVCYKLLTAKCELKR